jgi:adenosylcobinamide-phosphate guanylyltransferase
MAGGGGARLGRGEKPLVPIDGVPMIDRVLDALADSRIDRSLVVTSPLTPETAAHVSKPALRTPGDGYVADLDLALGAVDHPVLTVAADLPLLTSGIVDRILDETGPHSTTVAVPIELPRRLGATVETKTTVGGRTVIPTGVNVVGTTDETETLIMDEPRLAVNVNRPRDARIAEVLS